MEKGGRRVRVTAMQHEKRLDLSLLALKMETPTSQEILWPLEAEKEPASHRTPSSLCSHDFSKFREIPTVRVHLSFTAPWAAVRRVAESDTTEASEHSEVRSEQNPPTQQRKKGWSLVPSLSAFTQDICNSLILNPTLWF